MLTKAEKKDQIENLVKKINDSYAIVVWEYHSLKANQISLIKAKIKEMQGLDRVYKNRVAKIAFKDTNKLEIIDYLKNSSSFLIIPEEKSQALPELYKLIKQFTKGKKDSQIKIKAGYIENIFYGPKEILEIASLPAKEVLLSMLVSALTGNIRNLAIVLTEVAKKES
ncbi:MAG: 50S ribosomal protein L10 [Candidatus Hepatoplasma scabrum]|nr:MAG: 50S ribosomal protein L10 [Candidatus Hepatoplasma sp.]